jgi:hypothetical protein
MIVAYTQIAKISRANTPGSLFSTIGQHTNLTHASSVCNCAALIRNDKAEMHRPSAAAASRASKASVVERQQKCRQDFNIERIDGDLAGVLIGLKACILVSIQRHRNAGIELDPLLANASSLADLAVAALHGLRVDQVAAKYEEMGFWGAFNHSLFAFTERTATPVEFFIDARLGQLDFPEERALLILQAAHQALVNAEASTPSPWIAVRLFLNGPNLVLTVADKSGDFGPVPPLAAKKVQIVGLREPTRAHDGDVAVRSSGGGTIARLSVRFPRSARRSNSAALPRTPPMETQMSKSAAYPS